MDLIWRNKFIKQMHKPFHRPVSDLYYKTLKTWTLFVDYYSNFQQNYFLETVLFNLERTFISKWTHNNFYNIDLKVFFPYRVVFVLFVCLLLNTPLIKSRRQVSKLMPIELPIKHTLHELMYSCFFCVINLFKHSCWTLSMEAGA